jgi:hypothetical protein
MLQFIGVRYDETTDALSITLVRQMFKYLITLIQRSESLRDKDRASILLRVLFIHSVMLMKPLAALASHT